MELINCNVWGMSKERYSKEEYKEAIKGKFHSL